MFKKKIKKNENIKPRRGPYLHLINQKTNTSRLTQENKNFKRGQKKWT